MGALQLSCLLVLCASTVHSACDADRCGRIWKEKQCAPLEDCRLDCMFDLMENKDGCPVCQCLSMPCRFSHMFTTKHNAEKTCEELGDCDRREIIEACPNTVCQCQCTYGLQKGVHGCRICACAVSPLNQFPPHRCQINERTVVDFFSCSKQPCDPVAKCVKDCPPFWECKKECDKTGFKRDKDGCRMCACKEEACENVKCPLHQSCSPFQDHNKKYKCECSGLKTCNLSCPYGYHRDINGCAYCMCVKDPCEGIKCPAKLTCKPWQINVCLQKPCPFKAKCV